MRIKKYKKRAIQLTDTANGYMSTKDEVATIFADFETTSQVQTIIDRDTNEVITTNEELYKQNIDFREFMFAHPNYSTELDTTQEVKVWLAGTHHVESDDLYYMTNLDEFMNYILGFKACNLYFHNGGNFDNRFIYQWLVNNGFVHYTKYDFALQEEYFIGNYDSMTIYYKGNMCNLRDTTGILKGSIRDFGKTLGDISKGDTPLKYPGDDLTPSESDLDYLERDILILSRMARTEPFDIIKWYNNGIRTAASLAEMAVQDYDGFIDMTNKEVFSVDYKTRVSKDTPRMLVKWELRDATEEDLYKKFKAVYRDKGDEGVMKGDYRPFIDESGWVHSNKGPHELREKQYLSQRLIPEDYESFIWNEDYLEFKVPLTTKIKFNQLEDPNYLDKDKKLPVVPKDLEKFGHKYKRHGEKFTVEHVISLNRMMNQLNEQIDIIEPLLLEQQEEKGPIEVFGNTYKFSEAKKLYKRMFSVLDRIADRIEAEEFAIDLEEAKDLVLNANKGGLTIANAKYQCMKLIHDENKLHVYNRKTGEKKYSINCEKGISILDVNSYYPFIYSELALPGKFKVNKENGKLKHYEYKEDEELGYVKIKRLKAKVKVGKFPLIKLRTDVRAPYEMNNKMILSPHEYYLPVLDLDKAFGLTLLEYRYLINNYDIELLEIEYFLYNERDKILETKFKEHVVRWMQLKESAKNNDDQAMIVFSKLMVNSPYGKLSNYKREYDEGHITEIKNGVPVEKATKENTINKRYAHIAAGAYITAYGRVILSEIINQMGIEHFLYSDTDSIHTSLTPEQFSKLRLPSYMPENVREIRVHPTELGAWDLEGVASEAVYMKAKCYAERVTNSKHDNEWLSTISGVTGNVPEEAFKESDDGYTSIYTLRSINAPGGVSLYYSPYTITPVDTDYLKMAGNDTASFEDKLRRSGVIEKTKFRY